MTAIRLLLAHDLSLSRAALRLLLESAQEVEIVAEAHHPSMLEEQLRLSKPDVVVMVVSGRAGFSVSEIEVIRQRSTARIVVVSSRDEAAFVRMLLAAGASAYVCEQSAPAELSLAIRAAALGEIYIDAIVASQAAKRSLGKQTGHSLRAPAFLSVRETEVLQLLARGFTNKQIADKLSVSIKTAETYRARMIRKLGVKTRSELFRYAFEVGMIGPEQLPEVETKA